MIVKVQVVCLFSICFMSGFDCGASETNMSHSNLNSITNTVKQQSLSYIMSQVSEQSETIVCYEFRADIRPRESKKRMAFDAESDTVLDDAVSALKSLGFNYIQMGDVLLISSPSMKEVSKNPLDQTINGFVFTGKHDEFVKRLYAFGVYSSPYRSRVPDVTYNIEITESLKLRDLLLHVSAQYGVQWEAGVDKEIPIHHVKYSDGKEKQVTGYQVVIIFWKD